LYQRIQTEIKDLPKEVQENVSKSMFQIFSQVIQEIKKFKGQK